MQHINCGLHKEHCTRSGRSLYTQQITTCWFKCSDLIWFDELVDLMTVSLTCFQVPQIFAAHLVVIVLFVSISPAPDIQTSSDGYCAVSSSCFWAVCITLFLYIWSRSLLVFFRCQVMPCHCVYSKQTERKRVMLIKQFLRLSSCKNNVIFLIIPRFSMERELVQTHLTPSAASASSASPTGTQPPNTYNLQQEDKEEKLRQWEVK